MKSNHDPITRFAKPLVEQSRGFSPKSNHEPNHGNHVFRKTAGQAITLQSRAITRQAITESPPPLRGGSGCQKPAEHPSERTLR